MNYPEDFKKRVKELSPNFRNLQKMVDVGSENVGVCLRNICETGLPQGIGTVSISILNENELADMEKRKASARSLYSEWLDMQ